jgi:3-deoxy-manno-octulosonate cytidylyltransferase (CMP-KDO synthetase)
MIEHVWLRAKRSRMAERVLVAVDDRRVEECVRGFGGECVMTSDSLGSGSDRVAEAVRDIDAEIIINVQGDEPLIDPALIDDLASFMQRDGGIRMATVLRPLSDHGEVDSPSTVKAVMASDGRVLYFSRAPIPHRSQAGNLTNRDLSETGYLAHVGMYAYRKEALLALTALPPSHLELRESLEQLRALENGIDVHAIVRPVRSVSVDLPEHVPLVEELMKQSEDDRN